MQEPIQEQMQQPKSPFFGKYSEHMLKGLDKAYFNEQPEKYTLLTKYTEGKEKEFLFVYKHRKLGHHFGVFIPTDIEADQNQGLSPAGTNISMVSAFIAKHREQLEKAKVEFLLIPCTDFNNLHWTLLKISLKEGKPLDVEYYDPSVRKKPAIVNIIMKKLNETFNPLDFAQKIVLVQIEDINCGPFVHRMIQQLANKVTPDILPKTGIVERTKDAILLSAVKAKDDLRDPKDIQYVELQHLNPKTNTVLEFLVKHRRKIYAGLLIAAVATSVALLILFPPAGAAGLVATGVAAAGSAGVAAGVAAGGVAVVGTLIAAAGFAIAKVAKIFSRSKKPVENQDPAVISWTPPEKAPAAHPSQAQTMKKVIEPSNDQVQQADLKMEEFDVETFPSPIDTNHKSKQEAPSQKQKTTKKDLEVEEFDTETFKSTKTDNKPQ